MVAKSGPSLSAHVRTGAIWQIVARRAAYVAGFAGVLAMTVWSAILAKEAGVPPPLARVSPSEARAPAPAPVATRIPLAGAPVVLVEESFTPAPAFDEATLKLAADPSVRWFNGRPVRPSRTITMTVTAYSPDAKSCGEYADGYTATLHSVTTNAGKLVAADPKVLRMGAMLTVPGYDVLDSGEAGIVPVLDVGGKIKGNHIDLLFPTDGEARQWGTKRLRVTVWEYADGLPAENPRELR